MKRSELVFTHENIVDESISCISCYKINQFKYKRAIIYYILSLGIFLIITRYYPKIFINTICDPCDISEADYCLIKDIEGKETLSTILNEDFYLSNFPIENYTIKKEDLINSLYKGKEYLNTGTKNKIIEFRNNRYIYLEKERVFISINFELNKFRHEEIHQFFGKGFNCIKEFSYCRNKFGLNLIKLEAKSFLGIFFKQVIHPLYLYQIFSISDWYYISYYSFATITLIITIFILLINSWQQFYNHKKIENFTLNFESTIIRKFKNLNSQEKITLKFLNESSKYIVPGDIIEIKSGEIVPCDAVILSGYCNVNESDLTGESNLIMKTPIPKDNKFFKFSRKKSILFYGTAINKCESNDLEGKIIALAINTGFNTLRGNMIQNLMLPKKTNFSIYKEVKIYFIWVSFLYVINIFLTYHFYKTSTNTGNCPGLGSNDIKSDNFPKKFYTKILDCLTVILPPTLPICLTFTSFYFNFTLKKKGISCISDEKMSAAGKVNVVVLDKTGTITEEGLELSGFQLSKVSIDKDKILCFDTIESSLEVFNLVHTDFWKLYCKNPSDENLIDYSVNLQFNAIYFLECLATCHTIDKIKGEMLGNSIDKTIFKYVNWNIENTKNDNINIQYDFIPLHSSKILEGLIFSKKNSDNNNKMKRYKLTVIKRYNFSSKFQSNSVIVRNNLDSSYRFFIKGAPEKIIHICNQNTLPYKFFEKLLEHTQSGYRVLACATKSITELTYLDNMNDRTFFENDLIFLGFIVFKNKLKKDSKQIIDKLKQTNLKLMIATGDNPFTSISVAQESGLVDPNKDIYFCNLEKKKDSNEEKLHWYNVNIKKENFLNKISTRIQHKGSGIYVKECDVNSEKKFINDNDKLLNDETDQRRLYKNPSNIDIKNENIDSNPENKFISLDTKMEILSASEKLKKNTNLAICMTGKAFDYFLKNYREEINIKNGYLKRSRTLKNSNPSFNNVYDNIFINLADVLIEKCVVYARMQPSNKVDLVNFLKEFKTNIVSMCGDGANDCGALLSSDIGISISHKNNKSKVAAHFYSEKDSIECIDFILRNGRACYENNVIIFKFMILYTVIQNCSVLIFLSKSSSDFSTNQYLVLDCFVVLVSSVIASSTGAVDQLNKESITDKIIGKKFVFSIFGQIVIQCGFQFLFFFIIFRKFNICDDVIPSGSDNNFSSSIQGSYLFIFSIFQNISCLFTLNYNSKHRKKFFENKLFIFYLVLIIYYGFSFVLTDENNQFNLGLSVLQTNVEGNDENNEINRLILIISIFLNFIFTHGYENLLEKF